MNESQIKNTSKILILIGVCLVLSVISAIIDIFHDWTNNNLFIKFYTKYFNSKFSQKMPQHLWVIMQCLQK